MLRGYSTDGCSTTSANTSHRSTAGPCRCGSDRNRRATGCAWTMGRNARDCRFRISPDIYLIERSEWADGQWRVEAAQLRFNRELEYVANVDRHVARLVGRCTGSRTVRDLIAQLGAETGMPAERLTPPCLKLVRGLLEQSFLIPVP